MKEGRAQLVSAKNNFVEQLLPGTIFKQTQILNTTTYCNSLFQEGRIMPSETDVAPWCYKRGVTKIGALKILALPGFFGGFVEVSQKPY